MRLGRDRAYRHEAQNPATVTNRKKKRKMARAGAGTLREMVQEAGGGAEF
jgi:hypothetical protein